MPKIVSSTEAKVKLGTMMDWATDNRDEVVIESRGTPRAVLIAFEDYEAFKEAKEQAHRKEALLKLQAIAQRVQARNADLTSEEAEAISDDVGREVVDSLVSQGKVQFQS